MFIMSTKELEDYTRELEILKREITSSKDKSLEFLVSAGILDEKGEFTSHYSEL